MTEIEVSENAKRYLVRNFQPDGTTVCYFEATDIDNYRPDLLLFFEFQSPKRQWVTHSVESKRSRRYVTVLDGRKTCSAVKQARKYYANYKWLAISKDLYYDLTDEEFAKLKRDCKRCFPRIGLLISYKSKVEEWVSAGYNAGSWIDYYKEQNWITNGIDE
jgi:hypothetical protein